MGTEEHPETLLLFPLTELPGVKQLEVSSEGVQRLGRDPACEVELAHPAISRKHASIEHRDGRWILKDLGSRHGTLLNGMKIGAKESIDLAHGDSIALPPLVFRADLGKGELAPVVHTILGEQDLSAVETISRDKLGSLAARRLGLLMDAAATISNSKDESALEEAVLDVLLDGTGLGRAAVLRTIDGAQNVELRAVRSEGSTQDRPFSRTLVAAACTGNIVRLNEEPNIQEAHSIVGAGVQQAICAPVLVGSNIELLLYVDSIDTSSGESDAAAFTAAIATLHGLSLANLKRLDLEERQRRLLEEMRAARSVQERLMPPLSGSIGSIEYVVYSKAGRVVAGDLFGMNVTADDRVAVYLGDVAGKGVGAGMLMASIQASIEAYLNVGGRSDAIVHRLNEYVSEHSGSAEFATMFFLQFDPTSRTAEIVDGGHGYSLLIRGDSIEVIKCDGGPPVGAVPGMEFGQSTIDPAGGGPRGDLFRWSCRTARHVRRRGIRRSAGHRCSCGKQDTRARRQQDGGSPQGVCRRRRVRRRRDHRLRPGSLSQGRFTEYARNWSGSAAHHGRC